MYAPIIVLFCSVVGSVVSYNVQRELPYNVGPNDPYAVEVSRSIGFEPSQQLFWGNGGSNQVGGNGGLWSKLTNKFPFLENMFGRMQLPPQYVPSVQQQYGVPNNPQQYFVPQRLQALQYFVPQQLQAQQYYVPQQVQPQLYRAQNQQLLQPVPSFREVGFTDDAVIVTPPQVPVFPQPVPQPVAPVPAPAPAPIPVPAPAPAPQPQPGYSYNKPQYRLELPHK